MITSNKTVRNELKMMGNAIVGLLGITPVLGIENRVPMPQGDFVVMTVIRDELQSTNIVEFPDRAGTTTHEANRDDNVFTTLVIQLDCYGENARNTANGLLMLSRSDMMLRYNITPLFSTEPQNMPMTSGENQYIERWTLDMSCQFNVTWTQAQDSALQANFDTGGFYEFK